MLHSPVRAFLRPRLSTSLSRPPHLPSLETFPPHSQWHRHLRILAIESSCDDSCVAILDVDGKETPPAKLVFNDKVTSNNLKYGGIHPLRAMESHHANLAKLVSEAMNKTEHTPPDLVAVTKGPGMRNNLQTGIDIAKGLAVAWQVPLIGIHHMHAHALTARMQDCLELSNSQRNQETIGDISPSFPYFSLLVSGGHTILVSSESIKSHRILASTVDIAIGDCLDKVARLVLPKSVLRSAKDVSYGKLLEAFAFGREEQPLAALEDIDYAYSPPRSSHELVRKATTPNTFGWYIPMPFVKKGVQNGRDNEMSFSGIVAHVERIVKYRDFKTELRTEDLHVDEARALAKAAMEAAFEHLAHCIKLHLEKTKRSLERISTTSVADDVQSSETRPTVLALGGGVAANMYLRHILMNYLSQNEVNQIRLRAVPHYFCTDNAAMIAWAVAEMIGATDKQTGGSIDVTKLSCDLSMRALRRWSLENLLTPEVEEQREASAEAARDERQRKKGESESPQSSMGAEFNDLVNDDMPLDQSTERHHTERATPHESQDQAMDVGLYLQKIHPKYQVVEPMLGASERRMVLDMAYANIGERLKQRALPSLLSPDGQNWSEEVRCGTIDKDAVLIKIMGTLIQSPERVCQYLKSSEVRCAERERKLKSIIARALNQIGEQKSRTQQPSSSDTKRANSIPQVLEQEAAGEPAALSMSVPVRSGETRDDLADFTQAVRGTGSAHVDIDSTGHNSPMTAEPRAPSSSDDLENILAALQNAHRGDSVKLKERICPTIRGGEEASRPASEVINEQGGRVAVDDLPETELQGSKVGDGVGQLATHEIPLRLRRFLMQLHRKRRVLLSRLSPDDNNGGMMHGQLGIGQSSTANRRHTGRKRRLSPNKIRKELARSRAYEQRLLKIVARDRRKNEGSSESI